jgi:hypothetical protein
VLSGKQ